MKERLLIQIKQKSPVTRVAFVDYYYAMAKESQDGKKSAESGRWTDILLKQGTKWVMIGDHGGSDKKE